MFKESTIYGPADLKWRDHLNKLNSYNWPLLANEDGSDHIVADHPLPIELQSARHDLISAQIDLANHYRTANLLAGPQKVSNVARALIDKIENLRTVIGAYEEAMNVETVVDLHRPIRWDRDQQEEEAIDESPGEPRLSEATQEIDDPALQEPEYLREAFEGNEEARHWLRRTLTNLSVGNAAGVIAIGAALMSGELSPTLMAHAKWSLSTFSVGLLAGTLTSIAWLFVNLKPVVWRKGVTWTLGILSGLAFLSGLAATLWGVWHLETNDRPVNEPAVEALAEVQD